MKKPKKTPTTPKPTEFELDVLSVLWKRGPSTVRTVHEDLSRHRETGYTSVLKTLQIMTGKGLVTRAEGKDEHARAHIYAPTATLEAAQSKLLTELANRLFAGSTAALGVFALSLQPENAEALKKVRKALDKNAKHDAKAEKHAKTEKKTHDKTDKKAAKKSEEKPGKKHKH